MSPSLSITRSTIMHASLAYTSPELQYFNTIIRLHSHQGRSFTATKSIFSLPVELLLHIRVHLMAAMITHLRDRSTCALSQYEHSFRAALCDECIAYNEDIFGADVWQWTHFSGPCGCSTSVKNRTILAGSCDITAELGENHFTDASQWMESYLSSEALLLVGSHALLGPTTSPIWNLVHLSLREFGCEVLHGKPPSTSYQILDIQSTPAGFRRGILARFDQRGKAVLVVPLASALRGAEEASRMTHVEFWRDIILKRVERELGLSFEYPEDNERQNDPVAKTVAPSRPRHSECAPIDASHLVSRFAAVSITGYALIKKWISACTSLPTAFITGLIILFFCYYRKLGTLRNF